MTALGERTLVQHLTHKDSLALMAEEGLSGAIIPSDDLRPIVEWAIETWFRSGRSHAPSLAALRAQSWGAITFGDILDDHEIDMDHEPEDSVTWAVDDLRASYVHKATQKFNKDFATEMAAAPAEERVGILDTFATELVNLSLQMVRRDQAQDVRTAMDGVLLDYESRAAMPDTFRGMRIGLPEIDSHTHGIRPGELAVLAAGPKVGKSMMSGHTAITEHDAGRAVALFTLENSVEATLDRIACMANGVDQTKWQRGEAKDEEVAAIREWRNTVEKADKPLWVLQPDLGRRSFESMVREAQVREVDTIIVDQLTFVELPSPKLAKTERIGNALHLFKGMISTGRHQMAGLLVNQVSREGVKSADKVGHLELYHMADSAEVERTADWIFALYASRDDRDAHRLKFQILGSRRAAIQNWELHWRPENGIIQVRQPISL